MVFLCCRQKSPGSTESHKLSLPAANGPKLSSRKYPPRSLKTLEGAYRLELAIEFFWWQTLDATKTGSDAGYPAARAEPMLDPIPVETWACRMRRMGAEEQPRTADTRRVLPGQASERQCR